MIDPEAGAEEWTTLLVAGKRSPGIVTLSGSGLEIGWDVKEAQGQAGATSTRKGETIKKFTATFQLSNEDDGFGITDFDRWEEFQTLLESAITGSKPLALEVYHPDLARVHITAVSIAKIGMMALDGKGGGSIPVDFIEFKPPKPRAAIGAKQVKTEGDKKIDEAKAELAALVDAGKKPTFVGDAI